MEQQPAQAELPPMRVLVVGGQEGFLGRHLVQALCDEKRLPLGRKLDIHVAGFSELVVQRPGINHHACNLTDIESVRALFRIIPLGPQVIFNTFCEEPKLGDPIDTRAAPYYDNNYTATKLLLQEAARGHFVDAFVQSSSVAVIRLDKNRGQHLIDEQTAPLACVEGFPPDECGTEGYSYVETRAEADRLVLASNNSLSISDNDRLRTCCLRLPAIYGPRDYNITIPLTERKLSRKFLENETLFDPLYVENAVEAHILVAKALLCCYTENGPKVDGEAFFITDGNPMPFNRFAGIFESAMTAPKSGIIEEEEEEEEDEGEDEKEQNAAQSKASPSLLGRVTSASDKILRRKNQENKYISRHILDWLDHSRTYSVAKAKERLKYKPVVGTDEGVERAVEWANGPQRKQETKQEKKHEKEARRRLEKERKEEEKDSKERARRRVQINYEVGIVNNTLEQENPGVWDNVNDVREVASDNSG